MNWHSSSKEILLAWPQRIIAHSFTTKFHTQSVKPPFSLPSVTFCREGHSHQSSTVLLLLLLRTILDKFAKMLKAQLSCSTVSTSNGTVATTGTNNALFMFSVVDDMSCSKSRKNSLTITSHATTRTPKKEIANSHRLAPYPRCRFRASVFIITSATELSSEIPQKKGA